MKKNRISNERESGVIMMETLIMLPVYLVLLACIFWLGELCLIRQTLTTAERVRLWEDGTRHNIGQIAETTLFEAFLETPGTAVTSTRQQIVTGISGLTAMQTGGTGFATNRTTKGWGAEKSGFVQLNTRRSEWSWGIADLFNSLFWSSSNWNERNQVVSGRDVMSMVSRSDVNDTPLSSSVLFRLSNEAYRAEKDDFSGSLSWNSIYKEQWGDYIQPPAQKVDGYELTAVETYIRDSIYNTWSR